MLPLSFREFLPFYDFEIRETKSALGGVRGIADVGLDQEKAMVLLLSLIHI